MHKDSQTVYVFRSNATAFWRNTLLVNINPLKKMFAVSTVFLLLFGVVAILTPAESLTELYPSSPKNVSCGPDETACGSSCCPFPNADCCPDDLFECCPQNQACIPHIGICIGFKENSLFSTKTTSLRSTPVSKCPTHMTECAPNRCCPLSHAVCCSDGQHCCPNGYTCDLARGKCVSSFENYISRQKEMKPFDRTYRKSTLKSCPGGTTQCPWYNSCCLDNQGNWGCCPDPSLNRYKKVNEQCCQTASGIYICCPDICDYSQGCM